MKDGKVEYIAHRINTKTELKALPPEYGVELDLRDNLDGKIYIQHDPFKKGEDFEEYLKEYHHGIMILNIKSERIEIRTLELIKEYGVKRYFFLDSSFPMIYFLIQRGVKDVALRISELEGMDTLRNMAGKVEWLWVDCFTRIPIGIEEYNELKNLGYRFCLVSPELEGHDKDIENYAGQLKQHGMYMDAICTKSYNVKRWNDILS